MTEQVRIFRQDDGDLAALEGQRVAVLGYGNLGRPVACNLRSSGVDVVVGSDRPGATTRALTDGFTVQPIAHAADGARVVWMAVPDEVVPELLAPGGELGLAPGTLVCFSSGYPLAFDLLKLPAELDQVLLAPRMLGIRLRRLYETGEGFYSYVSVEHDATGTARARLLALARAVGTLRKGALEMSARQEAVLDGFVEQTVGPQIGAMILAAFEVGVRNGLPPEALVLELYQSREMAETWAAFAEQGFFGAVRLHGHAASFGGFIRLGDVDDAALKQRFGDVLEDIASGAFARRFQAELDAGAPTRALIEAMVGGADPLSRAESAVRGAAAQ